MTAGQAAPAARRGGPRRAWSVRLRLTVLTSGVLLLALTAGAVALSAVLAQGRVGALDAILRERSAALTGLVAEDRVPRALPVTEPGETAQVLDDQGRVVASSSAASRTLPLLPVDELPAPDHDGPALVTRATAYDDQARVAVTRASHRGDPVSVVVTLPFGEVRDVIRALVVALLAVVPALTALLAWAIWTVLGRALRPVEEMRRAAARVARTGGPGSLPVPAAQDELGALARTLNEMLDRLDHAAGRQRAFVADAAHELRSPVAALRAQVEVARAHPDAWSAAELATDLEPEVLRVQRLVDDLLVLARVGSRPATAAPVDLAAVCRDAVTAVRAAGDVPADVEVVVAGTGGARGDAVGLGRVVRNLVENAARHAVARVVVTAEPGRVVVDDDGPGVPAAERERVFERFVRLDLAREHGAGGSGLGLAIAREVARENGGDVRLDDGPLGGLRAVLTVPGPDPVDGG